VTSPRRNVVAQVSEARRSAKYSFAPTISFAGLLRSRIALTAVPQHLPPFLTSIASRSRGYANYLPKWSNPKHRAFTSDS
jgi:hypothetical protein